MTDLQKLIADRAELDAKIAAQTAASKTANVIRVKSLMDECGLTLADLGALQGKRKADKPARVAKYRDPQTGNAWVGSGRRPAWLAKAMASGEKLETFAV